jgi:iron(III) transport system ATP-binding protein
MLRPEQISISQQQQPDIRPVEVADIDFAGATGTVTLNMQNAPGATPLSIRVSRLDLPAPGDFVYLTVSGSAYVL